MMDDVRKTALEEAIKIAKNEVVNPPDGWPYDENTDKELAWTAAANHIANKLQRIIENN